MFKNKRQRQIIATERHECEGTVVYNDPNNLHNNGSVIHLIIKLKIRVCITFIHE